MLAGIDVEAPASAHSVVAIGDSITDGATATLDQDQRWTDHLAARLAPRGVAVVNAGISGGRLLRDGMGAAALARFQRDVIDQPGVASVIVLIGINDISWPGTAFARDEPHPTLGQLQAGYRALAQQARRHGLRILGATLLPVAGALPGTPLEDYYAADKDALRRQLNDWLRTDSPFDAVSTWRRPCATRLNRRGWPLPLIPVTTCTPAMPATGPWPRQWIWTRCLEARGQSPFPLEKGSDPVGSAQQRKTPGRPGVLIHPQLAAAPYLRFLRTYSTSECSSSS